MGAIFFKFENAKQGKFQKWEEIETGKQAQEAQMQVQGMQQEDTSTIDRWPLSKTQNAIPKR